jgi:hypothetical protein
VLKSPRHPLRIVPTLAARAPLLAKLTRPKHFDALPRERLFARLDEARSRPIV